VPLSQQARWVEPVEVGASRDVQRPAYHLVGELRVDGEIRSATLEATAHGIYEAFLNGSRIGDAELLPGCTSYRNRLQVHSFDVTELVRPGPNAVGFLLSDGWWRGQVGGASRITNAYGDTTAVLAELRIELTTGDVVTLGTDARWRSRPSHVLAADLMAGEVHDLRLRIPGWAEPGTERSSWDPVRVADHPRDVLVSASGPPVRRVEELAPVSLRELAPGRHVVDFGQNSNGWVRLTDLGPAGTVLKIVYGEVLDEHGDVTQEAIAESKARERTPPLLFQTDVVTSAGDGSVFEPRHSTKGFQFVRVEGHPGPLQEESIVSVVVHSDLPRIGEFSCSDERLNRLHRAADWSFRGNACDVPTDCPHRERAGWTGDWQVFVETAAYLYDVHGFSARWLLDLAAEQWEDGTVTNLVPEQHDLTLEDHARWRSAQGSSGWGDAACHVPWELYRAYGRTEVLALQLDSMRRWVDFAASRAAGGRHASRVHREEQPHERYLWDTGFHFGEWTEPDAGPDVLGQILSMDHGPTATAYLYRSATEVAQAAAVLGDADTVERYEALARNVRHAWCREFVDDAGHVQPQRQANLVRALAFGLLPEELRQTAADDLVDLVRQAGTHLGTGFLATPYLLPVLADHAYLDVAYELLLQDTEPSWLHMIDQGATTIWEDWSGHASRNHYSKGAVISFLHQYVAGLQLIEPGYRRFRVAPRPGGGLARARTSHASPQGAIAVAWRIDGGHGSLEVTVPIGATAELALPDGVTEDVAAGEHVRTWLV
jgi:alpha-L-rhamnosidase